MPRILAYHAAGRPGNGRSEGTNNLPRVLRRSAHGLTDPENFAARGLLVARWSSRRRQTQNPRFREASTYLDVKCVCRRLIRLE